MTFSYKISFIRISLLIAFFSFTPMYIYSRGTGRYELSK